MRRSKKDKDSREKLKDTCENNSNVKKDKVRVAQSVQAKADQEEKGKQKITLAIT